MIINYLEQFSYRVEHYFSDFKNAWEDYESRCVDMTTDKVSNQKSISRFQINRGKNYER